MNPTQLEALAAGMNETIKANTVVLEAYIRRVAELEATVRAMRYECCELRDILNRIGTEAHSASNRPAADLSAEAEARVRDR